MGWLGTATRWRELDGIALSCSYGDRGVEASFYVVEHDSARSIELSLHVDEAARVRVDMSLDVEFSNSVSCSAEANCVETVSTLFRCKFVIAPG